MPNDTYENYGYPSSFNYTARGTGQPFRSDNYNGMLVSENLPRGTKLVQGGMVYAISTAGGTAKAPVTAVPTTTASFAFWNGNAVTTKYCCVILEIEARLISGTSPVGASMLCGLSPTVQAAAVSGYSGVVGGKSLSASTVRASAAIIGGAITLAGAPVWRGIGNSSVAIAAGAAGGGGMVYQPTFPIIVPPYFALGVDILSTAGTSPLWGWTFTYAEIQLDLD